MTIRIFPSALALILACVPLAVWAEAAQSPAPAPAQALPAITVSKVTPNALSDRIFAGGLMQALETVQVAPLIEGQPIEALLVDVGDRVSAGEVLAELSKTSLELSRSQLLASVAASRATVAQAEAQVLEAEASAAEATRALSRATALEERGSASQTALDQARTAAVSSNARVTVARQSAEAARAQLASVEAQLANVELNLTRTQVVAPVDGEVLARNAQIGSIASAAGQPMFSLMRDGALELRVELSERDLVRIRQGQKAKIRTGGSQDLLTGTVRLVEPTVDPATRLGHARITLDMPGALRAGMYADAEILITERSGLAVPVTAITTGAAGTSVMTVDAEGRVARKLVTTGIRDAGLVEVLEGLSEGDMVVTKAGSFVRDGASVAPVVAPAN